jgi:hypothetical protein
MFIETFLVATSLLVVIIACLVFIMYNMILNLKNKTEQQQIVIASLLKSSIGVEQAVSKLITVFTDFTESMDEAIDQIIMNFVPPPGRTMYSTSDGKHSAPSIEGLMNKIKNSGDEKKYIMEDMDKLRNMFETESDLFDDLDEE